MSFLWPLPVRMEDDTVGKLAYFVLLVLSLTFHEFGHAWSAKKLGDDTAERLGRLTLNPLPHIDPIFTVLIPLIYLFNPGIKFFMFGAAKPVPVNASRLRHPTRDMMITSAAGPIMNVILAAFFTCLYWIQVKVRHLEVNDSRTSHLIYEAIQLNFILAFFNLIPVPPLDGHRVLGFFLPAGIREAYYKMTFLGIILLLVMMNTGAFSAIYDAVLFPFGRFWGEHFMPDKVPLWEY